MKTNRGRHNKIAATGPSQPGMDRGRMEKLYKWQRFTNKQREAYGYSFENYVNGEKRC